MSWIAVAVAGSAAIGAAANYAGSQQASEGAKPPSLRDLPVMGGVEANANPLFNALMLDLLGQFGSPTSGIEVQSSPTQVMRQSFLSSGGVKVEHDDRLQAAINGVHEMLNLGWDNARIEARIAEALDPKAQIQLKKALTVSGYQSLSGLLDEERKFSAQQKAATAERDALAPITAKGRTDAMTKIAQLQSDYPSFTQADIEQLSEVERQKGREAILQQANVGGFNPASGLAENERDLNPIARALALLGGRQDLSNNALSALSASLLDPSKMALATSTLGLNTALSNMGLSAQQAAILGNNAAINQAQAENAGSGTAAAGSSLAGGLQSLAFMQMMEQSKTQPGVPKPTTQYSQGTSSAQVPPGWGG